MGSKTHRGICPDMACERVNIETKRQKTENAACKVVAQELGVPLQTVRTWIKRNKVGSLEPTPDKRCYETCAISDLYALIEAGKKFGTIYADPPWPYQNQGTRSATSTVYKKDEWSMPLDG